VNHHKPITPSEKRGDFGSSRIGAGVLSRIAGGRLRSFKWDLLWPHRATLKKGKGQDHGERGRKSSFAVITGWLYGGFGCLENKSE